MDIDPDTFNICPKSLKNAIDKLHASQKGYVRGVIAVDLFGMPANYGEIAQICDEHGLFLIEDAAQGFGGRYQNKLAGSFGDIATTSFFPAKPLGCYGDGGAIFTNDTDIALAVLNSRHFIAEFVDRHNIAPLLIAANGWDPKSNAIIFDKDVYDISNNTWTRSVDFPYTKTPSDWEIYERFLQIFQLEQEKDTGLIKIGIEFFSPYISQQWVQWLVDDINSAMRARDAQEAERNITYLQNELENAQVESIKNLFFGLIEEQIKNKMITDVTPQYAFTVIDPPVPSLLKSAPRRGLIVIVVTFLACFLSVVGVIIFNTSGYKSTS